jgi:hypothetical protein
MRPKVSLAEARQAEERSDQRRVFVISTVLAVAAMAAALLTTVIAF